MRTPYDEGYESGYNDENPSCPYPDGSENAKEWWRGFSDGAWDS